MEGKTWQGGAATWQNIGGAAGESAGRRCRLHGAAVRKLSSSFQKSLADRIFFRYLHFSFLTFSKSKYNWHLHCSSCLHKCVVWQFWCFLSKLNCCPTMFSKTRTRMCDKRVKGNRNAVWKSATFIWRRGEQLLVKSQSSFQLSQLLKLLLQMFAALENVFFLAALANAWSQKCFQRWSGWKNSSCLPNAYRVYGGINARKCMMAAMLFKNIYIYFTNV